MPEVIPYCMKLALIKSAFAIHKSPLLNIKTTIQQNSLMETPGLRLSALVQSPH